MSSESWAKRKWETPGSLLSPAFFPPPPLSLIPSLLAGLQTAEWFLSTPPSPGPLSSPSPSLILRPHFSCSARSRTRHCFAGGGLPSRSCVIQHRRTASRLHDPPPMPPVLGSRDRHCRDDSMFSDRKSMKGPIPKNQLAARFNAFDFGRSLSPQGDSSHDSK